MPLVNWKRECVNVVPVDVPNKKQGKAEKVQSKRNIIFLPGWNEISEKDYEKIQKTISKHLDAGNFEVLACSFSELEQEPEKALSIIRNTYKIELLEDWRKKTAKDEFRSVIMNQIELVEKGGLKK